MNRKLKCFVFSLVVWAGLTSISAQDSYLDSLINDLPALEDSARYMQLRMIVRELHNIDPEESNKYAFEALALANQMGRDLSIASTLSAIGRNFLLEASYDSAFHYFENSIARFKESGDTLQMLITLENLAVAYQRDNQPEKAIQIYIDVMNFADQFRDWEGMTTSRINAASLYIDQKSYDRAIFHLKEIEKTYYAEEGNEEAQQIIQNWSPYMYINLGNAYRKSGEQDSALFYFNTCLKISQEIGDTYIASFAYVSIGDHFMEEEQNFYRALSNYENALEGFESIGDTPGIATAKSKLGDAHNELGNLDIAYRYLNDARELASGMDIKETLRDTYEDLSKNAEKRGNYREALSYYQQFEAYKDSLITEEQFKITQQMSRQYQTEKQELEISQQQAEIELSQKQKTIQQIIFGISILFIIGLGFILYSRYKLRQQKKVSQFTQKVNTAMSRFVPNEFIKTLGRDHIMNVELGDQVEKVVTILFTDIRSFTTISEGMTPKENFQFVKQYAERMGPIILRNGGFINQYLGDGLMAIFQNRPEDALTACIEMQNSLKDFNQELIAGGQNPIRVGMGMHTGPLVMGIIGDDERRDVALISDTVNAAARLESITKEYSAPILLSEDSYQSLKEKDKFYMRKLGDVLVKGKNKPMTIYECFNIDEKSLVELKQKTLAEFSNAVDAYAQEDFETSHELFAKVLKLNPGDPVSESFAERCRQRLA